MSIEITKEETKQVLPSIQKYMMEEFEMEISEMRAGFLLKYILAEIAPIVYNRAIKDAEEHLTQKVADLSGACYEQPFMYWSKKKK